ncbi:MAG: flagellar hook-length control protein FliK [Desulfuromonadaceae bacterium]|nr:flagellar hook-length control protein FliK [Desulfuromonadaceae bacterium]
MAVTADIQQQVFDLLSRASNISFVSADRETGGISLLVPGQRVSAEVVSLMPNNRVQVRVGSDQFNLELPMAVRAGQMLEMTFVSNDPRSTFAIARQTGSSPPVALSDASRLLSLLVSREQIIDPQLRSSLHSVSTMLRSSSGQTAVLANLLDEALTYGSSYDAKRTQFPAGTALNAPGGDTGAGRMNLDQARLTTFESNAAQILKNIAQNSRFTLIESANNPASPLPLLPGEEINATVAGVLSGGRTIVHAAGTTMELLLPYKAVAGEILRLTYLSAEPKPTFALSRTIHDSSPPVLSEAGRWLSILEHSEGGVSRQQSYVLERMNTVLKSLPPGSPAFTAISDDVQSYQRNQRMQPAREQAPVAIASQGVPTPPAASGNGIILSDDMAKLLQAVIKGNRLALLEALNQQGAPNSLTPGQQIKGEVMAALGGGQFTVQVAGQMLEFVMPKGVRRGDLINLFFITGEPKQTYLMVRFGRTGDSRISETGRWLSGFLAEASGQVPTQAALGTLGTLLNESTSDAPLLGRMLQQGLQKSGLFYESHLARWFGGDYALEEVLKEPQGRLSPRLAQTDSRGIMSAEALVRASIRTGLAEVMEGVFKTAGATMAHEGIADHRSVPIVSEQLSVLQNSQIVLRGDLIPGQRLEWTVSEREAGRNENGSRERSWETSVSIHLPHLGSVTAVLTLDGTHTGIRVRAENSTTVTIMESGKTRLIEQLQGAGLTPAEMSFSHVAP